MPRKKYTEYEKKIMETISGNLKIILKEKGVNQRELADLTDLAPSTVSDYVNGRTLLSPGNLNKIAVALEISESKITSSDHNSINNNSSVVLLPIVNNISMGSNGVILDEVEGKEEVPKSWIEEGNYFFLKAKGKGFSGSRITEGDLLLIQEHEVVDDGAVAVILYENELITRRVSMSQDTLILHPDNFTQEPIIAPLNKDINIIGKLKKVLSNYD